MKHSHKAIAGGIAIAAAAAGAYVTLNAPHRIGPADIYPPSWATGAINQDIQSPEQIAATICNSAWSTKSERPPVSYTTPLKIAQLKQLGYPDQNPADFEEDHLISLELGGNPTSTQNLWPEPYTASVADGGARSKDQVENYLHAEVCAGSITLQEAQQAIVTDWYAVLHSMPAKFGAVTPFDPDDEGPPIQEAGGSVSIPSILTVK